MMGWPVACPPASGGVARITCPHQLSHPSLPLATNAKACDK